MSLEFRIEILTRCQCIGKKSVSLSNGFNGFHQNYYKLNYVRICEHAAQYLQSFVFKDQEKYSFVMDN